MQTKRKSPSERLKRKVLMRWRWLAERGTSLEQAAVEIGRLIPGGRYSIDFAVALEIDKRLNHLPLDRQRRQMAREGLEISTQTMWDQEDALAELLEPSYVKLLAYILGADVIGADETHWRLMQPGSTKKWWVWCLTTDDAAWYMLEPSRSAETIAASSATSRAS